MEDKNIKISHIRPAQMAETYSKNTPIFAEEIKIKNKANIVTEATGFVGRNLVNKLLEKGETVYAVIRSTR